MELAVVMAIVLIIAAFAIPNLLRARESASDAATTSALRTITIGQVTYYSLYHGYAPSLKALGPPKNGAPPSAEAADLIDEQLASGYRSGYRFRYSAIDSDGDGMVDRYLVYAEPLNGGKKYFFVDEHAVIHRDTDRNDDNGRPSGTIGSGSPQNGPTQN